MITITTDGIAQMRLAARRSELDELELGIRASLAWLIASFHDLP